MSIFTTIISSLSFRRKFMFLVLFCDVGVLIFLSHIQLIPLCPHLVKRFALLAHSLYRSARACASLCICVHWHACSSVHVGDSAVPCSESVLPSQCCEDDVLPSWRGHTEWFLDGALMLPRAAVQTTETCSSHWKAASPSSPVALRL